MQSGGLEIEFQSIAHSTGDHEVPGTEYRSLRQASGHEGATENARPENAGLENDGPCYLARMFFTNIFNCRYTGWLLNSNIMMFTRMLLAKCTLVITLSDT